MPVNVDCARLRAGRDEAVLADGVADRAQPVAVEGGADTDAVGEDQPRRTVPRLDQRRVVAVEAAHLGVEVACPLPGFGDEHGDGVADVAAAAHQQLDGTVELAAVGVRRVKDRMEQLLVAQTRLDGAEHGAALHPADVARDGVDLAVVAEGPEGLGSFPGREGVGREPLVEDGEVADDVGIGEIDVERGQGVGGHQALVDDSPERAAGDVDPCQVGFLRDTAPEPEGGPLLAARLRRGENGLQELRLAVPGPIAQLALIGWRFPPLLDCQAFEGGQRLDPGAGIIGGPHEQVGHPAAGAEDRRGDGEQKSGTVAGAGIGSHRAAVDDARQAVQGGVDDAPRRATVGVGDEANAAGVAFAVGSRHSGGQRAHLDGLLLEVDYRLTGLPR